MKKGKINLKQNCSTVDRRYPRNNQSHCVSVDVTLQTVSRIYRSYDYIYEVYYYRIWEVSSLWQRKVLKD